MPTMRRGDYCRDALWRLDEILHSNLSQKEKFTLNGVEPLFLRTKRKKIDADGCILIADVQRDSQELRLYVGNIHGGERYIFLTIEYDGLDRVARHAERLGNKFIKWAKSVITNHCVVRSCSDIK